MSAVEQCSVFDFVGDVRLTDGLREITQLSDPREPLQEAPLTGAGDGGESAPCGWRREGTGGGGGGGGVSERMLCSACHCPFENREEQMEHYKLDWHRFNLRQRLRGRPPVSTDEFEKETGAGDLSSISGSDSDDDDDDSENGGSCRGEEVMPEGAESGRVSSRVVLQNSEGRYVSLHRCVLQSRTDSVDPVQSLMKLSERTVWVVLMTGGGHFAGSVFQGKEVLHHKTFHRYTVRAKRGTAQGLRDAQNRGHAPKSAGAALRRHNEAALVKDIQDLLESWADLLKEASVIFLRIPRFNRGVFFGRGAALDKNDTRIRTIPFATRRATFRETQRVHSVLSTLNIYNKDTDVSTVFGSCKRLWQKKPPKPTAPTQSNTHDKEISDEDDDDDEDGGCVELQVTEVMVETVDLKEFEVKPSRKKRRKRKERKRDKGVVTQGEGEDVDTAVDPLGIVTKPRRKPQNKTHQPLEEPEEGDGGGGGGELWEYTLRDALYTACKIGDNSTLIRLLQIPESPAEPGGPENPHTLLNTPLESGGFTLLHLASVSAQTHTVRLLLETGSDPACRDSKGQTPYAVAPDKDTRNAFRKFMAEHPDKYNYAKAQVPGPLNAEIQSKKAEKKKAQKAARKQREREHKEEKRRGEEEEEEKRRFLSLSDREKRALAAERRLAQQAATTGLPLTNSRRCFQCAESLLGKIPFEYLDFSFCSPRCVQTHRRNTTKP